MNLRSVINVGLLGAFVYACYCGYNYLQLRNAVMEELKSKPGLTKMLPDLDSIKIDMSQYPPVSCSDGATVTWWDMVLKQRSKGCYRFSLSLQNDTMKTLKVSADYDTNKLIGERFSHVMVCKNLGEVIAKDNGLPRNYQNCE